MKKIIILLNLIVVFSFSVKAQAGHDIKFNIKGCKDTMMYLVVYNFDQRGIVDTCKKVKNGVVQFKGKKELDKGVYTLVSQEKSTYFDFFINENQKFTISFDMADIGGTLKSIGNKENEKFFTYTKFINSKNIEFGKVLELTKGKSKEDSTKFINDKIKEFTADAKKYDTDFAESVRGTFMYDFFNLRTEKELTEIPKAKNNRPDSLYQYYYYKNHYFDGVEFKDERILHTPYFAGRIKKYFDNVIVQHPDTIIQEIDKVMVKTGGCNQNYVFLMSYFTYKYEQSKIMGFDKIFVHLSDKYIINGEAVKCGVYSAETAVKIKERTDIMRNLLLESKVADLFMIDTLYSKQVMKMGFDTAKTSKSVTDLYYKNLEKLTPMFTTLYSVKSKYTVLVFWASDCGHCKTEIPKLNENLKAVNGKIDFKVFAVQTKDEINEWRKFIIEQKLDFINVFDPVHLNNLKERFDIYSTPVIYILDKDKKIKAKRLGADQVVDMLKLLEDIDKKKS